MKHSIEYQGKNYHLETRSEGDQVIVEYEGERYVVTPQQAAPLAPPPVATPPLSAMPPAAPKKPSPSPPAATGNGSAVVAPMNGVIKKIHVAQSQQVAAQELVISMEAMKMEIDVQATQAGTISAIHVAEGSTVEHGDQLITIE